MQKILTSLCLLACSGAMANDTPWLAEARGVASAIPPKLLQVLSDQIAKGGPESAIATCSAEAPKMARAASQQTGWDIRRVSLRQRNAAAAPDAWERAALEEFDRRAAAGESPATLEKAETVAQGERKEMRYLKALPTGPLCLQCHGPSDALSAPVRAQLHERYPADQATGYAAGQIRGAISLRKAQ